MAPIVSRDRSALLIPGIVLAGGASVRVGRPKALLPLEGGTFVSRVLHTLRAGGLDDLVVVTGEHDAQIRPVVEALALPNVRVVYNPRHSEGQLTSLHSALHVVDHPGVAAIVMALVDHPLVRPETVSRLVDACLRVGAPVVRPVYSGRHGHPIVFARDVFKDLWAAPVETGARAVVRSLGDAVHDEPVDDPGVCVDVDTLEDYQALVDGRL